MKTMITTIRKLFRLRQRRVNLAVLHLLKGTRTRTKVGGLLAAVAVALVVVVVMPIDPD